MNHFDRRMKSFQDMLDTSMVVDAARALITVDHVDSAMELAFAAGVEPTHLFLSQGCKVDFSKSASGSQFGSSNFPMNSRNIDAQQKRVVRGVSIYDSEFGPLQVVPSRTIPQTTIATTNDFGWAWLVAPEFLSIGIGRDLRHVGFAKTGDNTKGMVRIEGTFKLKHPLGAAAIQRVQT